MSPESYYDKRMKQDVAMLMFGFYVAFIILGIIILIILINI